MIKSINNLQLFKLDCSYRNNLSSPLAWNQDVSKDRLVDLQKYLSGIRCADLIIGDKFAKYWSFVNGIIESKHTTPTRVLLNDIDSRNQNTQKIRMKAREHSLFLEIGVNLSDLINSPAHIEAVIFPNGLMEYTIYSFHVNFSNYERRDENIDSSRIIQLVTINLPRLLDLSFRTFISNKGVEQIKLKSVKAEREQDDDIVDMNFARCTRIENKFSYVDLRKISSVDIESILHLLPNTTYLALLECSLTENIDFNYPLNLSNLYLHNLTLDITDLTNRGNSVQSYVLHVEEKSRNRTLCLMWKRQSKKFQEMQFESVEPLYLSKGRLLHLKVYRRQATRQMDQS